MQTTLTIPEELHEKAKELAKSRYVSFSGLIVQLILKELEAKNDN